MTRSGNSMGEGKLLHVTAELNNLATIRAFVEEAGLSYGFGEDLVFGMVLAVDEAATNVIVHGYRGRPGGIDVEVRREQEFAVVTVRDNAPPFNPESIPMPDVTVPLEQRKPGGLGIFLIRQFAEQIIHRTTPMGGNELILMKRISA